MEDSRRADNSLIVYGADQGEKKKPHYLEINKLSLFLSSAFSIQCRFSSGSSSTEETDRALLLICAEPSVGCQVPPTVLPETLNGGGFDLFLPSYRCPKMPGFLTLFDMLVFL